MKSFLTNLAAQWKLFVAAVVGILVEKFGLPQSVVDGVKALFGFVSN